MPESRTGQPDGGTAVPARLVLGEAGFSAAWNLQGDPAHRSFLAAAEQQFQLQLPRAPNTTTANAHVVAFWLGPGSWLLVGTSNSEAPLSAGTFAVLRDGLNTEGGALFDVSASRVAFTMRGPQAATVLAKGCPLDFHLRVFPAGACAQSLFGHIGALFYRPDSSQSFVMMVARSFARDAWHSLCGYAAQYGYDVAPVSPWRIAPAA